MRLILVRHGETEENVAGILQGQTPGVLTAAGIDQARKLALRLKDEKIDFIYSSDLKRASDTAEAIAAFHLSVPFELTPLLRERSLGDLHGFQVPAGENMHVYSDGIIDPPNGETFPQMAERAEKFFHEILGKHHSQTVLCVAHNGFNRTFMSFLMKKNREDVQRQPNTAVNIFEIDESRNCTVSLLGCVKHLQLS